MWSILWHNVLTVFVRKQDGVQVYLPMAGLVDKEKERSRLLKQAEKLIKDMEMLKTRLGGSNFVEKVGDKTWANGRVAFSTHGQCPLNTHLT